MLEKNAAQGGDRGVGWGPDEHARTNTLERRFSAGSSGDAERRAYTEMETIQSSVTRQVAD